MEKKRSTGTSLLSGARHVRTWHMVMTRLSGCMFNANHIKLCGVVRRSWPPPLLVVSCAPLHQLGLNYLSFYPQHPRPSTRVPQSARECSNVPIFSVNLQAKTIIAICQCDAHLVSGWVCSVIDINRGGEVIQYTKVNRWDWYNMDTQMVLMSIFVFVLGTLWTV